MTLLAGSFDPGPPRPTGGGTTPLLEARALGRRASGEDRWLLRGVDLVLRPGDRLVVFGPSGSGKSLLLRALALLDPVDAGKVLWRGRAVADAEVPEYRSKVVLVPQRPALSEGSVEDNLVLPFGLRAHAQRRYSRSKVLDSLSRLGRGADFVDKRAGDLSGGEAQITAFVRAFQLDPAVLLLDEPTASLDLGTARRLEDLVRGWLGDDHGRRACVWVSHDADQARRVGERQIQLEGGRQRGGLDPG